MLRSRGNRLPSERAARSPLFLVLPPAAVAPANSRSIVAAVPRLSPLPLSYFTSRSIVRTGEDLSDSSSLSTRHPLRPRGKDRARERTRFLSSLPSSRAYLLSIVFIVLWISPPAFRDRASRWTSAIAATGAHVYVHTLVPAEAHCSRREPRLFSNAWPRFLTDFIPIHRNKLADDHGGICLLGDLFFPALSLSFSLSLTR